MGDERAWLFFHDLKGGALQPITPEGTRFTFDSNAISPDSAWVATISPEGELYRYAILGDDAEPIARGEPGDVPIQWDAGGNHIYVYQRKALPTRIFKLDLSTGQRELWKELQPADSAGVFSVSSIFITQDGEGDVYSYRRMLSDLYLVSRF